MRLSPIIFETEGIYRCEVSNEFPVFDTVSKAEILKVVGEEFYADFKHQLKSFFSAIPSGPFISPSPVSLSPGDIVDLNCSVTGSLPRPSVFWYINKSPVPASTTNISQPLHAPRSQILVDKHEDGRIDTYTNIRFRIGEQHFQVII